MTIPALPITIIYAPPVDQKKLNTSGITIQSTWANTTNISLSSGNSSTTPVPTKFSTLSDIEQQAGNLSTLLKLDKDPTAQTTAGALSALSAILGSATATLTTSNMQVSGSSTVVGYTNSVTQTAQATDGGPGIGDVIVYYYNARVVWYSDGDPAGNPMQLAILGFDGQKIASAGEIISVIKQLRQSPIGSVDSTFNLDLESAQALITIDPFIDPVTLNVNPAALLPSPRFTALNNGVPIQIAAGGYTTSFQHQLTTTDSTASTTTNTIVQTDKAGLPSILSVLGLTVTDNQTLQASSIQSSSSQTSLGTVISPSYTFHTNGNETYTFQPYYDAVFNAFAFSVISGDAPVSPTVAGVVSDQAGKPASQSLVKLDVQGKALLTCTDDAGRFVFYLPHIKPGVLALSASTSASSGRSVNSTTTNIHFAGTSLGGVRLQTQ